MVSPGLEDLALKELNLKVGLLREHLGLPLSLQVKEVFKGGITLGCLPEVGFALNPLLKIPTRILLRLESFRSRDFSDLFNKVRKLPWERFFRKGEVKIKVTSQRSRLKMKTRIEQSVQEALSEHRQRAPWRKAFLSLPQTLYVRIEEDEVTLSVDTSGEALFKRGFDKQVAEAPVRETLASGLYFQTWNYLRPSSSILWVDPMCGSGTLLLEALGFFETSYKRSFAYQNFPGFPGFSFKALPKRLHSLHDTVLGFDRNVTNVELTRENLRRRGFPEDSFAVRPQDFFAHQLRDFAEGQNFGILLNPPYGERLKADLNEIAGQLERFLAHPKLKALSVIWPKEKQGELPKSASTQIHRTETLNGGLPVQLVSYFK